MFNIRVSTKFRLPLKNQKNVDFMVIKLSDVVFYKVTRLTESYQVVEDHIWKFDGHKNLNPFNFWEGDRKLSCQPNKIVVW